MKAMKFFKVAAILFLGFTLTTSCSKDDDGGDNDKFAGVPKGEIVPLAEREQVLTGYDGTEGRGFTEKKWWKQDVAKVDYHCAGYEDEDLGQENIYYAFAHDGTMYYKVGVEGEAYSYNTWEWEDSDKDAIVVDGVVFDFRELNEDTIVYASYQEQNSSCYAVTWEQYSR